MLVKAKDRKDPLAVGGGTSEREGVEHMGHESGRGQYWEWEGVSREGVAGQGKGEGRYNQN